MPPQVNARVVNVNEAGAGSGGRDDWETPGVDTEAGAGAVKWAGVAPAYYRERVQRVFAPGATDVILTRTLWIDTVDADLMGVDTDDVITFVDQDGGTKTARAITVARSKLAGIPSTLQTTRLDLELA